MTPPETPDGFLSLNDRFGNIEASLGRIEAGLANKVDQKAFDMLIERTRLLESGETPLGKYMLKIFDDMQRDVADIARHGSPEAQEAVNRVAKVEATVSQLRTESEAARAVLANKTQSSTRTFRIVGAIIGALSTAGVVLSSIALLHP